MPLSSLDKITIKGFRSIAALEDLSLGPINILIGANGSGKSNFVGARILGNARHRGGIRPWPGVRKDIVNHLMGDRQVSPPL